MSPSSFRTRPVLWVAAALLATGCSPAADSVLTPKVEIAGPAFDAAGSPARLVISQIYGGGGNTSATFNRDFVEIYNAGGTSASLEGLSIQYASATGSGAFGSTTSQLVALSGSLNPGRYFLIQLAGGSTGAALPTPDLTGTINMSGSDGKVALVQGSSTLGCNGGSLPCSAAQIARIIDLVGFGGANFYEGAAAPKPANNATALFRKEGGAQDTDNNAADFEAKPVAPRNSSFGGVVIGPLDRVTLGGATTIKEGLTGSVVASVTDAEGDAISAGAVSWSVDGASVGIKSTTARSVTLEALTLGSATVTASYTEGEVTRTATRVVTVVEAGAPARIDVSFPDGSLPPGFDYFPYPTVRDADGAALRGAPAALTYTTSTPAILSIDPATNLIRTKAEGRGYVTLTATNGFARTFYVDVNDGREAGASYQNHIEFGVPADATPGDEILLTFPQYVASYNAARGQPNWVAYNLEGTHKVPGAARCDCFTPAPGLGPDVPAINMFDYSNSGYSRGHLVMSADRTVGSTKDYIGIDNARTFYFSNIIPQTAANNEGAWGDLETHLGTLATAGGKEIFIVAGGARYSGTLRDAGKVAIPTWTWKVAVILDKDETLAAVRTPADLEVIAVAMPNTFTMASSDWEDYAVSVDSVEALSGYDVLSLLSDNLEVIVESRALAQLAALDQRFAALAGLSQGERKSLGAKLDAAAAAFARLDPTPAGHQLNAFANELEAMVRAGRLEGASATPLIEAARVIVAGVRKPH